MAEENKCYRTIDLQTRNITLVRHIIFDGFRINFRKIFDRKLENTHTRTHTHTQVEDGKYQDKVALSVGEYVIQLSLIHI